MSVVGLRYNQLLVLEDLGASIGKSGTKHGGQKMVKTLCDCGKISIKLMSRLKYGVTKSCGCIRVRNANKMSEKTRINNINSINKHPLYGRWKNMKTRCYLKGNPSYENYGARGIQMCKEWKSSYETFYNWCIENGWSKELVLDRIDNYKGYGPDNCRLVTPKQNARNKRDTIYGTIKGITMPVSEWSELHGISHSLVRQRINKLKWSLEDAVTTPTRKMNKTSLQSIQIK